MKEEKNRFLTTHVDILENFFNYLWKDKIKIINIKNNPQELENFSIFFENKEQKVIECKVHLELCENGMIDRVGVVYQQYFSLEDFRVEKYIALSFLYHSPYELELCNQYGLYNKEEFDKYNNSKKLNKIRTAHNLLEGNQFYIFNMGRILDHCSDYELDQLLQRFHNMCMDWNHHFLK